MAPLHNRSTIPSGMLHPAGLFDTPVNAAIQSTTRPAGTLLRSSPGYDSIRRGKNRFQGKGPSGGFRDMTYAEDVGGTGAALSVVPGTTTAIEASEYLPENADSVPEGTFIIADRGSSQMPTFATRLHEGFNTIPDMGDRHPDRPLSKSRWLVNPVGVLREDYRRSPAMTVAASVAFLTLFGIVAADLERSYGRHRGRGVGTAVTGVPAAAAETSGNVTANAADEIGKAADTAVEKIGKAADDAVSAIKDVAKDAKETTTGD